MQRGVVGEIISRFEKKGYKLAAMKARMATADLLNQHYHELIDKPFFPTMRDYMLSGPVRIRSDSGERLPLPHTFFQVVSMIFEGKEAVKTGRKMLGATNPLESDPGTIRGDFCLETGRNICHGSDSVENAEREINLWFDPSDILDWASHSEDWVYE